MGEAPRLGMTSWIIECENFNFRVSSTERVRRHFLTAFFDTFDEIKQNKKMLEKERRDFKIDFSCGEFENS